MQSTVLTALLLTATTVPLALSSSSAAASDSAGLTIRMSGFRSAGGQVLIAIYRGEQGFPGTADRAWKTVVTRVADGRASISLADVPVGDYAIAVVHDENGNNKLDTSWIGMPREGIGTSNNAKGRMGPPKYRDAKFAVTADGAVQAIKIAYL